MFSKSTIKYIQSLQHKKFRDKYNAFMAEGPKLVAELLEAGIFNCTGIYAVEEWVDALPKTLLSNFADKLFVIKGFELEKISGFKQPNQVLAVFEKKIPEQNIILANQISLLLDDIQDPGNLGTIIRIADWFGICNIICSLNTADIYNAKVVQSTMASLGRVNVFYTDIGQWLFKNKKIKKYAATLDGMDISTAGKIKEGVIIIGNESKGISDEILQLADIKITIPRIGNAESLNAAVATGIILHSVC